MTQKASEPTDYSRTFEEIKTRVQTAQYEALKAVNRELIALYWDIDRSIIVRQQDHGWGRSVLKRLAAELQQEFQEIKGFSARNIWYMSRLYLCYHENETLQPLVAEIEWEQIWSFLTRAKMTCSLSFVSARRANSDGRRSGPGAVDSKLHLREYAVLDR